MEDMIFDIVKNWNLPESTATKVYNAVMAGADAWSVYAIIVAATGPFAIGVGVIALMIKTKLKSLARAAAIAW